MVFWQAYDNFKLWAVFLLMVIYLTPGNLRQYALVNLLRCKFAVSRVYAVRAVDEGDC